MIRRQLLRLAAGATAIAVLWAGATGAAASDTLGRSTVEQRIAGGDPGAGFQFLGIAPGEGYTVREDGLGVADPQRAGRRRSLLYFAQFTDFQLADEESPARVEFVDVTADDPFPKALSAAWRPQEALVPQMVEESIRQVNAFAAASPVEQGGGGRAQMAFAITTGDSADSQQLNETETVVRLLEGGTVDPNSGSSDPADYAACPPGTPGPAEAARYTGVQDYDDYVAGSHYYDPDRPAGPYAGWPSWPGLMDRAQAPFQGEGLAVPSYVAFGNHDGLVQGNAAAIRPYEDVGTSCVKPLAPAPGVTLGALQPSYLQALAATAPGSVALVPPDPRRRYVSKSEYKRVHLDGSQPDGHGFGLVDQGEQAASNGAAGYYAWRPRPGFRFIALDTVSEAGVPGPSANGNIDDPQFRWLGRELDAADAAGELVVVFGHHPIRSLDVPLPDELAPPCTVADPHGHDLNPGCDVDPRDSSPIHQGADLQALLLAHPRVIAYVAGHTHENKVTPFARPGGGGFWGIETASEADWPHQNRLLEVMDNEDGTLSIFGTVLDNAAPVAAPPAGASASAFGVDELAAIGRTLGYNDPQAGPGPGDGQVPDRNVELLVRDPR